jgi:ElaB/YqjD/DUF883 family membrane-anchored ribosome-binding protein
MFGHNGKSHAVQHAVEEQLEAIRSQVKKLVEQVSETAKPAAERVRSFGEQTTDLIRAYPIAAAGIAFGLGYLVVRIARR